MNAATPIPIEPAGTNAAAAGSNETGGHVAIGFVLDLQGLRASEAENGVASLLPFGAPADETVEALTHIIGAPPGEDSSTSSCGTTPTRVVRWESGFTLVAREGRFVGWEVDRPGYRFDNGVEVGSSRRALDQGVNPQVTRRGSDILFTFGAGDHQAGGSLSGARADGRVASLHAGVTCHAEAAPAPRPGTAGPTG